MLEQQNDSLQINSAQSQARVLSLEQERVGLFGSFAPFDNHNGSHGISAVGNGKNNKTDNDNDNDHE